MHRATILVVEDNEDHVFLLERYEHNLIAFHLRAMNMLYEGLKENATIVIGPSTAVESMQLGGLAGMTALTMGLVQERGNGHKEVEFEKQMNEATPAKEILTE
jgi:hypothetical protein